MYRLLSFDLLSRVKLHGTTTPIVLYHAIEHFSHVTTNTTMLWIPPR